MPIEIIPYTAEWVDAVEAFNQRMKGSGWGWYADPVPDWVPKLTPDQKIWREYWIAVEDKKHVRGAYALKPQDWWIRGETKIVTDWHGPVSEGLIDKKYNMLGIRLMRDMLKRRPLLYSWGHGGDDAWILQVLRSLGGWLLHQTPYCLRIVRPNRFLRLNGTLRKEEERRRQLDLLASSGAGWLGLKALHAALTLRGFGTGWSSRGRAKGEIVERFGEWADALWDRVKHAYQVIGLRDRAAMNLMVPEGRWPHGIKVQVTRDGATIGWAVVTDTQQHGSAVYGDMRTGAVVDVLAHPDDARDVVQVAFEVLADRGVDMVLSNQAHPVWADAFAANGFVVLPDRRIWAASPELYKAIQPYDETRHGLHLTNMDGHGPHGL